MARSRTIKKMVPRETISSGREDRAGIKESLDSIAHYHEMLHNIEKIQSNSLQDTIFKNKK